VQSPSIHLFRSTRVKIPIKLSDSLLEFHIHATETNHNNGLKDVVPFNKTALEKEGIPSLSSISDYRGSPHLGLLLGIWGFLYPNLLSLFIPAFLIFLHLLVKTRWGYLLAVASLPIINLQYIYHLFQRHANRHVSLHALILPPMGRLVLMAMFPAGSPARFKRAGTPFDCLRAFHRAFDSLGTG
jgi:hypothetical protein